MVTKVGKRDQRAREGVKPVEALFKLREKARFQTYNKTHQRGKPKV